MAGLHPMANSARQVRGQAGVLARRNIDNPEQNCQTTDVSQPSHNAHNSLEHGPTVATQRLLGLTFFTSAVLGFMPLDKLFGRDHSVNQPQSGQTTTAIAPTIATAPPTLVPAKQPELLCDLQTEQTPARTAPVPQPTTTTGAATGRLLEGPSAATPSAIHVSISPDADPQPATDLSITPSQDHDAPSTADMADMDDIRDEDQPLPLGIRRRRTTTNGDDDRDDDDDASNRQSRLGGSAKPNNQGASHESNKRLRRSELKRQLLQQVGSVGTPTPSSKAGEAPIVSRLSRGSRLWTLAKQQQTQQDTPEPKPSVLNDTPDFNVTVNDSTVNSTDEDVPPPSSGLEPAGAPTGAVDKSTTTAVANANTIKGVLPSHLSQRRLTQSPPLSLTTSLSTRIEQQAAAVAVVAGPGLSGLVSPPAGSGLQTEVNQPPSQPQSQLYRQASSTSPPALETSHSPVSRALFALQQEEGFAQEGITPEAVTLMGMAATPQAKTLGGRSQGQPEEEEENEQQKQQHSPPLPFSCAAALDRVSALLEDLVNGEGELAEEGEDAVGKQQLHPAYNNINDDNGAAEPSSKPDVTMTDVLVVDSGAPRRRTRASAAAAAAAAAATGVLGVEALRNSRRPASKKLRTRPLDPKQQQEQDKEDQEQQVTPCGVGAGCNDIEVIDLVAMTDTADAGTTIRKRKVRFMEPEDHLTSKSKADKDAPVADGSSHMTPDVLHYDQLQQQQQQHPAPPSRQGHISSRTAFALSQRFGPGAFVQGMSPWLSAGGDGWLNDYDMGLPSSSGNGSGSGVVIARRLCHKDALARRMNIIPTQDPFETEESTNQEFREAYLNSLLAECWKKGEAWARLDLSGIELSTAPSSSDITYTQQAKELAYAVAQHQGVAGVKALLIKFRAEWNHLRSMRQRYSATGGANNSYATTTVAAVAPSSSSVKTSILKVPCATGVVQFANTTTTTTSNAVGPKAPAVDSSPSSDNPNVTPTASIPAFEGSDPQVDLQLDMFEQALLGAAQAGHAAGEQSRQAAAAAAAATDLPGGVMVKEEPWSEFGEPIVTREVIPGALPSRGTKLLKGVLSSTIPTTSNNPAGGMGGIKSDACDTPLLASHSRPYSDGLRGTPSRQALQQHVLIKKEEPFFSSTGPIGKGKVSRGHRLLQALQAPAAAAAARLVVDSVPENGL